MGAVKRLLLGRPLASEEAHHQLLPKILALPIFASDALSSVAYATEEIMLVLLLAGTAMDPGKNLGKSMGIAVAVGDMGPGYRARELFCAVVLTAAVGDWRVAGIDRVDRVEGDADELGRRYEACLVVLGDPHLERPERPALADCLDRQLNRDFRGHRTQEVAVQ